MLLRDCEGDNSWKRVLTEERSVETVLLDMGDDGEGESMSFSSDGVFLDRMNYNDLAKLFSR